MAIMRACLALVLCLATWQSALTAHAQPIRSLDAFMCEYPIATFAHPMTGDRWVACQQSGTAVFVLGSSLSATPTPILNSTQCPQISSMVPDPVSSGVYVGCQGSAAILMVGRFGGMVPYVTSAQCNYPNSLWADTQGLLATCWSQNSAISVRNGILRTYTGLNYPSAVTRNGTDLLVLTSIVGPNAVTRITEVNSARAVVVGWAACYDPRAIIADGSNVGNFLVTCNAGVYSLAPDLSLNIVFSAAAPGCAPRGVAQDSNGAVYVSCVKDGLSPVITGAIIGVAGGAVAYMNSSACGTAATISYVASSDSLLLSCQNSLYAVVEQPIGPGGVPAVPLLPSVQCSYLQGNFIRGPTQPDEHLRHSHELRRRLSDGHAQRTHQRSAAHPPAVRLHAEPPPVRSVERRSVRELLLRHAGRRVPAGQRADVGREPHTRVYVQQRGHCAHRLTPRRGVHIVQRVDCERIRHGCLLGADGRRGAHCHLHHAAG